MKKYLLSLFIYLFTQVGLSQNIDNLQVISKEQRCQIANNNLLVLSDTSKPIYQTDDNGRLLRLTYSQILEQREENQKLITNLCQASDSQIMTSAAYGNLLNKAKKAAEKLGFKETKDYKFNSHGQPVYRKSNKYITRDTEGHNGGVWKVWEGNAGSRSYTADANFKPIKK